MSVERSKPKNEQARPDTRVTVKISIDVASVLAVILTVMFFVGR